MGGQDEGEAGSQRVLWEGLQSCLVRGPKGSP